MIYDQLLRWRRQSNASGSGTRADTQRPSIFESLFGGAKKTKPPQGTDQYQEYTQYRLSRLIILGAFVFIGGMLIKHFATVNYVLVSNNHNDTAIKNILDKVDASNQTIFNILFTLAPNRREELRNL
ncbi:MAG TPA: hypothetical protein VFI70_07080 [Nitrososphaeraceae archaeon]|nr:hypothetical protein [Nitrososphaeraceae archaeon]